MNWGTAPQWITALIAAGALFAAYKSIQSQREIARKRAAMDFFAKTEMDSHALEAYSRFSAAVVGIPSTLDQGDVFEEFKKTDEYRDIRAYLNLHELMSVGISQNVFDDDVCYYFWSGELERAYRNTEALILRIQNEPGEQDTYIELIKVARRWAVRN